MFKLLKNRKHENVGRVFHSPYFDRKIRVVAFNSDDKWWFCFEGTGGTADYSEHRAETKLSYFVKNKLEVCL